MTSYMGNLARGAVIAALAVACVNTPDQVLSIQDPDIINPGDVQSAAGANAVRVGALARLNAATTGGSTAGEGIILLGGLLADEWRSGDSFVDRDQIDRRTIIRENGFATNANRLLHRARLSAAQAIELYAAYNPTAPAWHVAEMFLVMAYIENLMAEHYCSGIVFSRVVNGVEQFGVPAPTAATLALALAHADSGLALITGTTADDNRVRSALQITRGRILMNQDQHAAAATAVAGVATTFRYRMVHSQTTNDNQLWALNNSARRYNVSGGEGGVGIDFVTPADPRVPSCAGGTAPCTAAGVSATGTRTFDNNANPPFRAQLLWPARDSSVAILSGVDARLLEAEAAFRAGNPGPGTNGMLDILNTLRTTVTGLTPLVDAGSDPARIDQLFRESAFWQFGRGYRLGNLRRLMRQYGRTEAQVFPTGAFHKAGNYGTDVNFPIPQAEDNNPLAAGGCIDRLP